MPPEANRNRPSCIDTAGIAVTILLLLAATAWARPLMLPDEGRYVGVAWEMLRSGNWLTPTLDGLPYFHKPPLFYWITAGSLWAFGSHDGAARAAPILGGWIGALSLYLFLLRWRDRRTARWTLLPLLTQPLFFVGSQFANLDMLVAGLITVTIVLAAHAVLRSDEPAAGRLPVAAAWFTAALAVLAKGLIGIVIPAAVIVLWLCVAGRWRAFRVLAWWPGVALFVLTAAPWFVAMQVQHPGFLDYFFVVQHFKRYAGAGFNNVQPLWFFPVLLLVAHLPWTPWLHGLLRKPRSADAPRDAIRTLAAVWVCVVVIFFSLPGSKLVGYVLPALPPLALLIGDALSAGGAPARWRRWGGGASAALSMAVGLAFVAYLAVRPMRSTHELAAALAANRQAHQPVVMLRHYWFDLPYYARLKEPVAVVDSWSAHDVGLHDNWRKELADAGTFDAQEASRTLLETTRLSVHPCVGAVTWIVGFTADAARFPVLAHAQAVARHADVTLWRLEGTVSDSAADWSWQDACGAVE